MPVQKGKKKPKRIRRQFGSLGTEEENGAHEAPTTTRTSARSGRAKPARRERKKAPLWVNTTIGGAMLAAGIYFLIRDLTQHNAQSGLIFLLLYWALAALYLSQAFKQYRARRQAP